MPNRMPIFCPKKLTFPDDHRYDTKLHVSRTYPIKIKKQWYYLDRAVDSTGATLDFMLSATRDACAAERFFRKVLDAGHTALPRVITVDQNAAYPPAFEALQRDSTLPESCLLRPCKYLNNVIEIVFTQMTKTRGLAARMGGKGVADLNLTIGYEDPVNQELYQGPLLGKRGVG
jgi:transposase-like protein